MKKWIDLSLRNKILSVYILIISIFFLLGIVIIYNINKVNMTTREVETINFTRLEIVNSIERTILTIKYLEVRSNYLSSEKEILENYEEIMAFKNKIDLLFSEFENLSRNEPKKMRITFLTVKDLFQEYFSFILKEKEQWLKEKAFLVIQEEKEVLRLLDEKLEELRNDDINHFSSAFGHIGNLLSHTCRSYFIILLAALLISFSFGYKLAKVIIDPMKSLLLGMQKLSEGDWSYKIEMQSNDELGMLQMGFTRMAYELREVYGILEKQKNELEVRVIERTKEIKQLHEKLEEESMKLALGLSEIFELLRKVADGDLSVKLNPELGDELLNKLAQVVNLTIINLGKSWEDLEIAKKYAENIIESIKDMIIITDFDTNIRFVNSATIKALKFSREELIGKPVRVIFGDDIKSSEVSKMQEITIESALTDYEMFFKPQEGMEIPVILDYSTIKNNKGDIIYKVYTAKDISERKRAEDLLRENEWRYRNLINISPEVIALLDQNLNIIMINKSGADLYGYSEEKEMIGMNISQFFEPEEMGVVLENTKLLLQNGEVRDLELVSKKKDGSAFYIELSAVWVMGSQEDKYNFLLIFSDISLRKQTEKELKDTYDKLKELQSQLVQSEKMAAIGQLAGGVAHEINNPLTGVLNNVQLIKMMLADVKTCDLAQFKELLDIIEESALRCKNITSSLLEFSHVSVGTFKDTNINEVIEKVISLVQKELNLQNIAVEKHLDEKISLIKGDPQLLQQIIVSLISNAKWSVSRKFPNSKEGRIVLKTQFFPGENMINVFVSDNGMGIPKDKINKIFEPFFTTKQVGEGTGLGLSVVYSIVKKHNGAISVESIENLGAVFKVSFPCVG